MPRKLIEATRVPPLLMFNEPIAVLPWYSAFRLLLNGRPVRSIVLPEIGIVRVCKGLGVDRCSHGAVRAAPLRASASLYAPRRYAECSGFAGLSADAGLTN
jgi:hypothetical protein